MRNLARYLHGYHEDRLDYVCNLSVARYLLEYQSAGFRKSKYDVASGDIMFSFRSCRLNATGCPALASFHPGRVG